VRISEDERFVICYNPEGAERDAQVRARMLAQLGELINDSGTLTATGRAELRGAISAKPGLNRYLRITPGGLLRIDANHQGPARHPRPAPPRPAPADLPAHARNPLTSANTT
jgi:hypothetical protein